MSVPAVTWGEFLINSEAKENAQKGVQLQALDNGKFLAVWEHEVINELGVRSVEIYAQRFYSGAVPEGEPVRIDTTSGGINSAPTVTMLADGKLVYTWEHQTINEDGVAEYSVRARIFNADGTPFDTNGAADGGTDDFEVANADLTVVSKPIVKALSGGGFVITYNDVEADGVGDAGVKAVVYDVCGRPAKRKKNLRMVQRVVRADVCAASTAAVHTPRARMGVRGSGPIRNPVLMAPVAKLVFLIPSQ